MVARVCLAAVAALAAAWLGVLLRDAIVVKSAGDKAFFTPQLSAAEFGHEVDRLESARLLEPGHDVDELLAGLYWARGLKGEYTSAATEFTRDEPQNVHAWMHLYRATHESDPSQAAAALSQIKRLNPLAAARLSPAAGTQAPSVAAPPPQQQAPRR